MPSGHADKATINQRRKLTQGMIEFLIYVRDRNRAVVNETTNPLRWGNLTQGQKNCCRALVDRGLMKYEPYLTITPAGTAEAAKHENP